MIRPKKLGAALLVVPALGFRPRKQRLSGGHANDAKWYLAPFETSFGGAVVFHAVGHGEVDHAEPVSGIATG